MQTQAIVPFLIQKKNIKTKAKVISVCLGVGLMSALAQISIPLPFTPVPLTGQTFGVTLVSLLLGRKLGFSSVLGYLALGFVGLPVFASGKSGLLLGPTLGYLVGMGVASWVVGGLADHGFSCTFWKAFLAGCLGSLCVFTFGLIGLSFFVPFKGLFMAGLFPFIPGDILKTTLAAGIASRVGSGFTVDQTP